MVIFHSYVSLPEGNLFTAKIPGLAVEHGHGPGGSTVFTPLLSATGSYLFHPTCSVRVAALNRKAIVREWVL